VDGISLAHAVGIWALRLVIGTPVDVAVLARASGIGAWRQVRSALPALAMSLAMAGVVLLVGHALGDMPLELRLAAMVASGAASYAVLVLLLRRALIAEAARLAVSGVRRRAA